MPPPSTPPQLHTKIVISAGYGSPALPLLRGLPRVNPERVVVLPVQAVGPQAALENPERAAAVPRAPVIGLKAGLPMDGAALENPARAVPLVQEAGPQVALESPARAVLPVRDGAHLVHHGPLERVARAALPVRDGAHLVHGPLASQASLDLEDGPVLLPHGPLARVANREEEDGTPEATDGVESPASPRDPSPREASPREASRRDPREDGAAAALAGAAATLAGALLVHHGPLESRARAVDHLVIGLPTQVIGLTMDGVALESQERAAAVDLDLETHGPTEATTGAVLVLASQARAAAVDLETHG